MAEGVRAAGESPEVAGKSSKVEEAPIPEPTVTDRNYHDEYLHQLKVARSRVWIKKDMGFAGGVIAAIGLLGVPLGWLWSWLAPPQRVRVVGEQQVIPLQLGSWHRFDDLVIFALLGLGAGVVIAAILWLFRERRGPVLLMAGVVGCLMSAWLATRMGITFASNRYEVTKSLRIGDVLDQAPTVDSLWVVVVQPLGMALAYGLCAGWNRRDDLGRRLDI